MTRCFVAFELSEKTRAYLAGLVEPLYRRLNGEAGWPLQLVPRANWHCTLLFFKGLAEEGREAVWREIETDARAGVWRDLPFAWEGPSLWPLPRRPNLLCLAAAAYPAAAEWPLEARLATPPFDQARAPRLHRYHPHITVMRFRRDGAVDRAAEWEAIRPTLPPLDSARIRFDRISLFLSGIPRESPVYPRERTMTL